MLKAKIHRKLCHANNLFILKSHDLDSSVEDMLGD